MLQHIVRGIAFAIGAHVDKKRKEGARKAAEAARKEQSSDRNTAVSKR